MQSITSRDNQWIKLACSLKQKKGRQAQQRVFMEGYRLLKDAAAMGLHDVICFVSPKGEKLPGFTSLQAAGEKLGWDFYAVTASVYDKLKDTKTPQGLAAMVPYFTYTWANLPDIAPEKAILYLRNIQDPGNLGTILRTAAAANTGAVFLSEDSVDVYNDKTIRSAMGAIFKVPIIQNVTDAELSTFAAEKGRVMYGTAMQGTTSYTTADYQRPLILAFGNEGSGLEEKFLSACATILRIPMRPNTESLNLSMAVGLVLYKAWEKNNFEE